MDHLVAGPLTRIGHIDIKNGRFRRGDARVQQARWRNIEGRVAEAMPEREQRLALALDVLVEIGRGVAIVVDRQLAHGMRESDRQLATRIDLAEQHVGESVSTLLAQIPAFQERIGFLRQAVHGQRTAVDQQRDDRFAGGDQRLDQGVLVSEQAERVAIAGRHHRHRLAGDLRPVAEHQQHHVRALGDLDGLGDPRGVLRRRDRANRRIAMLADHGWTDDPDAVRLLDGDVGPRRRLDPGQDAHGLVVDA